VPTWIRSLFALERRRPQSLASAHRRRGGCETWSEARKKKRNNVDVLFSEAKAEALTEQFATLMAWATWGEKNKKEKRQKSAIESAPLVPSFLLSSSTVPRTGQL